MIPVSHDCIQCTYIRPLLHIPTHCSLLEKSDEPLCPMCSNSVKAADLKKIEKLSPALTATDTGDV